MKTLKLDHHLASLVLKGSKTSTWRIFDDKDLSVDDQVSLIDKVDAADPGTWRSIGTARITKVVEKHLGAITAEDAAGHEQFPTREKMLATYRQYYGQNVTFDTPVKIVYFDFTPFGPGEGRRVLATQKASIYADGASRGNPGPSATGYAVYDENNNLVTSSGTYLGVTTNNQAEYTALKLGLEEAERLGARHVTVHMDSLLVVNQMRGIFKVTNRDLWPIHDAVKKLCDRFEDVSFTQIPRELNKVADAAANKVLDAHAAAGV